MRFHHATILLGVITLSCLSTMAQDEIAAVPVDEPDLVLIEDWASETFDLPPSFAPELPAGTESLRFPPGWRDSSSENFWSYAFVMSINEPAPDIERVEDLLKKYYDGLMSVFASNKDKEISVRPAQVEVERITQNHFEAQMHLVDAFATFEPIDIRVQVETIVDTNEHSFVNIQVSQQPKEHKVWRSLDMAIQSIHSQTASLKYLKERSKYSTLDKQGVADIAQAAQSRWEQELSGFIYQRVEHFSAGGVSHWISIWLHEKTGLEFVLVPGGRFLMGSPASEAHRREDELQHWVVLDPFLIARTECTQEAWAKLATASGAKGDAFEGAAQLPKVGMNPEDVETWCRQGNLTLPTEAQWEFMCRAGTTSAWAMGANKSSLQKFANLGSLECPEDWSRELWLDGYGIPVAPVAMFAANAFGLFDVHGNVCEWIRDHYFSYETPVEKGTGRRSGISGERMARGGNFGGDASFARSAARFKCGACDSPGANKGFGFRPSLDLPF